MQEYIVNNRNDKNQNQNHEVHTKKHALELKIEDYTSLNFCKDGNEALAKAKKNYNDADGCRICCPEAHTE